MSTHPSCFDGGYLVGEDDWLPTDPHDRYAYSFGVFVGCSRLTCRGCGQAVRQALGYWSAPAVSPAALHAAPDWSQLAGAAPVAGASGRLYACACTSRVAHGLQYLVLPPNATEPETLPPWGCAGHPALALPDTLGGVALAAAPDWGALALAQLGVAGHPALHRNVDRLPGFVLTRIYTALDSQSGRDQLSHAVGACANHADASVRAGVALFFALNPGAAGLDALLTAWQAQPALYDGASPWGPEPTLRSVILQAIGWRLTRRGGTIPHEPIALATLRWAATHSPGLGSFVYWLPRIDPEWMILHLDAIVALALDYWAGVLGALRVTDPNVLVPACLEVIRSGRETRDGVLAVIGSSYGADFAQALDRSLPS